MVVSVKGSICRCFSIDEENNKICSLYCGLFLKIRIIYLRLYCKINYKLVYYV